MAKKKHSSRDASSSNSENLVVVLPGDNVTQYVLSSSSSAEDDGGGQNPNKKAAPKIGTGLRYDASTGRVFATAAGRLERQKNKAVYYVRQNLRRRYRPVLQDRVVGIIEDRVGPDGSGGDVYRVNIGASHPAILSNLSFEGATKRNRPAFSQGQLLYARVAEMHAHLDPVLSCQLGPHDGGIPRKDWMTAEGCYGELRGGTVVLISTGLARELLRPDNVVLNELAGRSGARLAFEVAVGVNGYLWIHSPYPEHTILIQNAITNSEVLTEEQVRGMVKQLVYTVQKQMQQDRDAMEE